MVVWSDGWFVFPHNCWVRLSSPQPSSVLRRSGKRQDETRLSRHDPLQLTPASQSGRLLRGELHQRPEVWRRATPGPVRVSGPEVQLLEPGCPGHGLSGTRALLLRRLCQHLCRLTTSTSSTSTSYTTSTTSSSTSNTTTENYQEACGDPSPSQLHTAAP